jgi:hypothetical protein
MSLSLLPDGLLSIFLVFRVAHDSAKGTRIWAGEAKKR